MMANLHFIEDDDLMRKSDEDECDLFSLHFNQTTSTWSEWLPQQTSGRQPWRSAG